MGMFYRNRTLIGNISLVVFMAFLVTLTFGAFPGTAAAVTVTPGDFTIQVDPDNSVAIKSKDGTWKKDGDMANLVTNKDKTAVKFNVQVLTADSFDSILLNVTGIGDLDKSGISNAVYKVYEDVYGPVYYAYQFVYDWVYSSGLSLDTDYTLEVYSSDNKLASIDLNLEAPPPVSGGGGGGGGGGSVTVTTTTSTDAGSVTTKGDTSTLAVDQAKLDTLVADENATTVELAVSDAKDVKKIEVPVTVKQLDQIFEAGKDVTVSFGDVQLAFTPDSLDLTPFAGQDVTVKFEISKVADSQVTGITGTSLKLAGAVYELNIRVLAGNADKGGIHSFSNPVTVSLPYDSAKLDGASEDSLGVYRFNESTKQWDYVGGEVDKANNVVTLTLDSFSKYAVMSDEKAVTDDRKTFTDLAGHWAKADVELMAEKGIVAGMTETTFGPDLNVTRAQFAALLQRSLNLAEDKGAAARFTDVKGSDWFAGSVGAAATAELVKGYEDGTFRPGQLINRQEMAAMIARALAYSGKAATLNETEINAQLVRFSDAAQIGDWAKEAVAVAVKQGIVYGRTAELFDPASNATRAEAAVMLKRMLTATGSL